MRIGIRVKLLAGFVATALFTRVLGWYAASSMERLNDGTRCLEAGMDDYLPKPVRLEDLDAALRRWLEVPPTSRLSAQDASGTATPTIV